MKQLYPLNLQGNAQPKSIFVYGEVRVTVLFDRLIRVEKCKGAQFVDAPTQGVWYRNFPTPDFSVEVVEDSIIVKTDVTYMVNCRDIAKSTVTFANGRVVGIFNDGALEGTARTLDRFDGEVEPTYQDQMTWGSAFVKSGKSFLSKQGVGVLDDSQSLLMPTDGNFTPRKPCLDLYIFAHGNDFRQALKDFYALTGATPLVPRFALGNWWSRYHPYTDVEYLNLMDKFAYKGVPIAVATVDMDWHYVDIRKHFGADIFGWTGYSWNEELFPNYREFLQQLHKRNLAVTLNLHPADGVRFYESQYQQFAKNMGMDPQGKQPIACDYTNPNFVKNYFELLHHPYQNDGVDFWWIDWQQGSKSKVEGLDPLWLANHYHYQDICQGEGGLILSRYCGAGAHRYPLGFSGDTVCTWGTLGYVAQFTVDATNVGFTWWSHDIGAHFGGYKDDELYLRWLQFGVFSPVNRLHSSCNPILGKEMWKYKKGTELIATEYLRLRHKLIPYLYTYSHLTARQGLALVEPLFYQHPTDQNAYDCKNIYYFGSQLVVAPITQKSVNMGLARRKAYLPDGVWQDIFTNHLYQGGQWVELYREVGDIPVFAKQGAIVPLSLNGGNDVTNPTDMEILCYAGNGSFQMIEDDGNGNLATTTFTTAYDGKTLTFTVKTEDDAGVIPQNRNYVVNFKNVFDGKVTATYNGNPLPSQITTFDNLRVKVQSVECQISLQIGNGIDNLLENPLAYVQQKAVEILDKANCLNQAKSDLCYAILGATHLNEVRQLVNSCSLADVYKGQLLELFYVVKG